ncbi:MAG: sensor histidine kinase [Gemmiger sp.]
MKFAHKIALTFVVLLAAALSTVGLAMTAMSFARSLAAARSAAEAQLRRDAYGVEQAVFSQYDASAALGADPYGNARLAAALQTYTAGGAPDAGLALWVDGTYSLFSTLPVPLPRQVLQAAAAGGQPALCPNRRSGAGAGPAADPARPPAMLLGCTMYRGCLPPAGLAGRLAGGHPAALALGGLAAAGWAADCPPPGWRLSADGRRTMPAAPAVTDDEIGALSESFDRMAGAVEAQVDRLNAALTRERDFVAAFTHELKTPMTSMMGYAALLRRGPQDPAAQAEAADFIYHETRRLEALGRKLLALLELDTEAGIAPAPVTDTALFAALERAFARRDPGAGLRFEPAGCRVAVDRTLWEDLLRNLIRNALTACRGRPGAGVTVGCRAEGDRAVFTVADTGCGIPPQDLPRLTEPFYMVDKSRARAGGGSGLGLALCARIAAVHGTALEFASTPGAGTTVTVRLPLCPDADEEVTPDAP